MFALCRGSEKIISLWRPPNYSNGINRDMNMEFLFLSLLSDVEYACIYGKLNLQKMGCHMVWETGLQDQTAKSSQVLWAKLSLP